MTALDVALTTPERTAAAGPTTIKRYLFAVANSVVATARINQSSFLFPQATLTVDTTSGWTDVRPGMTALIGSTSGASDVGTYRVRQEAITGTTLPIAETSVGDPGLLPMGIRPGTFNDDQFITIVNTSNFYSIIPLISGGVVYEDYSRTASNFNSNPAPLVYVLANNEHSHIAVEVDSGQTYATIVFVASSTLWPTSASATYAWTAPSGWGSPTAGAINAASVTYHVPRNGQTNDVLKLVVTENSVSQQQSRAINVWVYEKTGTYAPIMITDMAGDQWDDNLGYSASLTLNDNLLASIPDGAMVLIKDVITYNGTTIASACDQFVGWLVRATKHGEPGLRSAEVEVISPAGLLNSRRGSSQIWSTAFTGWELVPASLLSLSYAMWWLLKFRAYGVLEYFDVNLYSTAPAGQRLPQTEVASASLWSQLTNLADGILKRQMSCDPDGTFWVRQHPSFYLYSSRLSDLVVRDTLDASIISDYDLPRELVSQVGWVQGEAFTWDGAAATPTPLLSMAPGSAPGQGAGEQKVQGQVVATQNDLNGLLGNYYPYLNPDYSPPTLRTSGNRGALYKPAQRQMVRWQVPAASEPTGVALDRYIIPKTIRRTFVKMSDGSRVVDTEIAADIETTGVSGETIPVPAANDNLYDTTVVLAAAASTTSANAAYGLFAGINALAGINRDGYVYQTGNLPLAYPTWVRASLGVSGTPEGAVGNPFSARYLGGVAGSEVDAWIATTTGIYYVTHIEGTPSASLQKTFRGTTSKRSLQMEFASQFLIVCVSVYSDGTYETHSTDGTTWSAEALIGDATTATCQAGCAVSSRNIGKIYTSAIKSSVGAAYDSTNSGSSYALLTNPAIDPGSDLCGDIHIPYNNNATDAIAYYGKVGGSSPTSWNFLTSASPFTVSDPAGAHNPAFTGSVPGTWVSGHGFESGHISTPPSDIELYAAATGLSSVSISYFSVLLYPTVNVQFNIGLYFLQSGVWTTAPGGSFYAATAGVPITYSQSFTARPNVTGIEIYISRASSNVVTGALEVHSLDIAAAGPSGRHFEVANGATISDISPTVSGTPYGPWQSRQVDSDGSNRQLMVAALGDVTQTNAGIWVSSNGFASNTQLVAPAAAGSRYERAAISGDGTKTVYAFGTNGVIGASSGFAPIADKRGNIASFSPGTFIQVMGL